MIRIIVKPDEGLTVFEGHGLLSAEEIDAALRAYYQESPVAGNWLWDLRDSDLSRLSRPRLRDAIILHGALARKCGQLRQRRRVAYVGASALQYGLGRMAATVVETAGASVNAEVFQSMVDALAWVTEQADGLECRPLSSESHHGTALGS